MQWGLPCSRLITPLAILNGNIRKVNLIRWTTQRKWYSTQVTLPPKPHYTTTPIFYVNAAPHIGHLHSIVLADVFSRWAQWRNKGWSLPLSNVDSNQISATRAILATGTDEHGIKIQQRAESLGESPRDLCNRVSQRFRLLADKANASHTRFIRTTDADHVEAVKYLWNELEKRGYIYKGTHEGWYAVSDEAFYSSQQIRPQERGSSVMVSIETGSIVEWSSEETFKFKLSQFQDRLLDWLETHPKAVMPASRRDELIAEVRKGLSDLSVSRPRSRLHWGIPCPSDEGHTIYVWLDALTNYLTVSGFPWKNTDGLGCWPTDVQLIGKDILRFHAVYFPAFLMALDLPLPRHTVTHGHWTVEGQKMSKSRGNVIDPFKTIDEFGADEMRWFLCRMGGNIAADADWSEPMLHEYHRKYLQSQWGSFLTRIFSPTVIDNLFADSDDVFIEIERPLLEEEDAPLNNAIESLANTVDEHMSNFDVKRALESIGDVLAASTVYFHHQAPWKSNRQKVYRTFYYTREACRISALLAQSVLPTKMREVLDLVDQDGAQEWPDALKLRDSFKLGRLKGKIAPLFPKLKNSITQTI